MAGVERFELPTRGFGLAFVIFSFELVATRFFDFISF